jgi:hypothetical protein
VRAVDGSKSEELTGGWIKLNEKEHNDLYPSLYEPVEGIK